MTKIEMLLKSVKSPVVDFDNGYVQVSMGDVPADETVVTLEQAETVEKSARQAV